MCNLAVRDTKGKVLPSLMSSLNRYNNARRQKRYGPFHYKYVTSKPLGRGSGPKDQYVFLYRQETVNVTDTYQYDDTKKDRDVFTRDPFAIRVKAPKTEIGEFVLIPLQATADGALQEIDKLYDVYEEIKEKWNIEDVMLLGDFYADCGYVTKKSRQTNRLFTSSDFFWLIGDKVDTCARAGTDCAYDRIVVHGKPFLKAVEPLSAQVFNYKKTYRLSQDLVMRVSDHFPVEVNLKTVSSGPRLMTGHPLFIVLSLIVSLSCTLSVFDTK
ncbi:deoxyribonuclease gamma-like [Chanos chanos]|uniref:Deoxyribonuclease n=1 Tax=Chanos chanos TaxID=29144 RepID=A0A6J2UUA9_CHACN|nr:deoxyribonuclease gamma-like [Chanos chanos]